MQEVKSVKDAEVSGKRVLVRVDFNVPLDASGGTSQVADDTRIRAAIPTLELLHARGAAEIIVVTHLGRPGGTVVDALRTAPVAQRLHELCVVPNIVVLENILFDPREAANDSSLARELASRADVFVNDAFADLHRPYATHMSLPHMLPSYAGLLVEKEIAHLSQALTPPPGALAILGGAKFETKVPLITTLLQHYTQVLLGGALGSDVIKARGMPFGASLTSAVPVPEAIAGDERVVVASDVVLNDSNAHAEREALVADIQASEKIVDVGPASAAAWADKVAHAPFVLWNGPLGIYEDGYTDATDTVARALAQGSAHAVVGGGDTVAALAKFSFDDSRVFVSTGGGAMLEFLATGTLPGIEALKG